MSDLYVFPVVNNTEAIDMPLSVLEAMSCSLPVISTRFGGLVDYFEEDTGFRYFNTTDRKSTRLNSSHIPLSRMPSSA